MFSLAWKSRGETLESRDFGDPARGESLAIGAPLALARLFQILPKAVALDSGLPTPSPSHGQGIRKSWASPAGNCDPVQCSDLLEASGTLAKAENIRSPLPAFACLWWPVAPAYC